MPDATPLSLALTSAAGAAPPLLVTRPEPEASAWVRDLRAAGWNACALPLIEIGPAPDALALQAARTQAGQFDAWMFVSVPAVRGFAPGSLSAQTPRCWAPGPGTARALLRAGVAAQRIDQPGPDALQFDSEALWQQVQAQVRPGFRLLVVRGLSSDGSSGRDWLQQRCEQAGAEVQSCLAYQRLCPDWDADARQQVQRWAEQGASWVLSSTQALQHLLQLCPGQSWARCRALVSHPRIAASAQQQGFGEIISHRPQLADLLRALSSSSRP